jgi:hypothetical protein
MIRIIMGLAAIALALHAAPASGAESLTCEYKQAFKEGGWRHAHVTLTVEEGKVDAISYRNGIASGKEGGGYLCAFDAAAVDGKSVWTREKGRTVVELKGEKSSTFEIYESKKGFSIRFMEMSKEYCGFGAEFPESVHIDKGKAKCRVKF